MEPEHKVSSEQRKEKAGDEDDGHVQIINLTSAGFDTERDTEIAQDIQEDRLSVHHRVSGKRYYVC